MDIGIPKYVSPEQYSKMTAIGENSGLGPERIKELCEDGLLPCIRTRSGNFRIKVYNEVVPVEEYEKVKKRCIQLEAAMESINVTSQVFRKVGDSNDYLWWGF